MDRHPDIYIWSGSPSIDKLILNNIIARSKCWRKYLREKQSMI